LFNVAESMDRQEVYGQRANELMEMMQNAQTQQGVANEQMGVDLGMGQTETTEAAAVVVNEHVAEAQAALTAANAELVAAQTRLAELVSQGLGNLDPPVQAAREAAEAARVAAESADAQSRAVAASVRSGHGGKLFAGGRAKGGSIGSNEFGMVGEAGPEFISGPANVMSANTSMGVMQNLMKGIKNLDSSVQENSTNSQNTISNSNVGDKIDKLMTSKFDTMIQQLQMLVAIESNSVNTQTKSLRATKSLQGNMLKGI
jgi:hypothetical protein